MFHKLSSSMFLCFITLWISPCLIHSSMSQGGMKSPFIKGISISINFYELWYDCNMWGLQPHSNLTKSATLLSCVLPPLLWLKLCRVFIPLLESDIPEALPLLLRGLARRVGLSWSCLASAVLDTGAGSFSQ